MLVAPLFIICHRGLFHDDFFAVMDVDASWQVVAVHLAAHEVIVVVVLNSLNVDLIDCRRSGSNYAYVVDSKDKLIGVTDGVDTNVVLAI